MKPKHASPGKIFLGVILILSFLNACRKEDDIVNYSNESLTQKSLNPSQYDSYVINTWYQLMLKLTIETPGHVPPVAARNFAYTGVALYESLQDGMHPGHHSLAGQLNGLTAVPERDHGNSYAPPVIANAALARMVRNLFANASSANLARIDSLEAANHAMYASQFNVHIVNRSRDYGRAVADAIFNWSATDGGYQAYLNLFPTTYIPPTGDAFWIATPPAFQSALLPYWGNNRPFLTANAAGPIDPPAHPVFSTDVNSSFYSYANQVYTTVNNLTTEQQTIANYWADGGGTFSPPGHNVAIVLQMIRNTNMDLASAAILLAKTGIAENDAGIVCWRAKFSTNLLRPVTYIRNYIDANWLPFIATPPFPTYTSGHSTFSGAAAKILTMELGENFSFTDSTKIPYGFAPRSFSSFQAAAQEAALSRLYGGIHYAFDNENGFHCGELVALNIENLNW
jgi:membrane-associated phospholipid phosphatase